MSQAFTKLAALIVGTVFISIVGLACEKKPPQPAAASIATPEPLEAQKPDGAPQTPALPSLEVARPSAGMGQPVRMVDDPGSPSCLPGSDAAGGWVKKSGIKVFDPSRLHLAVTPADAPRLRPFRIRRAAICTYAIPTSAAERVVEALIIETQDPADAYGILTCQSPDAELLKVGGETRIDRSRGYSAHCWQGNCYVRLRSASADLQTTEQIARLLVNIAGQIPRAERPAVVDALPRDSAQRRDLWLVRDLASIPQGKLGLSPPPDPQKMGQLLGLGEAGLICVGQYVVPEGRRPNVVWVARYPTAKAAYEAHARYRQHLARAKDPFSMSTNLLPAHGTNVVGTWTAEEESLQYVLPRISKLLPS